MKIGIVMILLTVCTGFMQGQSPSVGPPGTWRTFTNMNFVRETAWEPGFLWAATSGGLFRWDMQTQTFARYTNVEGISSNDLTAITIDGTGRVWIGASDGSINVLAPGSFQWQRIDDIRNSGRIQRAIRTFLVEGDSILIGTDFGVSVFRLARWEFGDTYANFGFASSTGANAIVVHHDSLWVATDQGVAAAPRFLPNLSTPSSWIRFQTTEGLPFNHTMSLVAFHDTLVAATDSGCAYFDGSSFQQITATRGIPAVALSSDGPGLSVLQGTAGYLLRQFATLDGMPAGIASDPSHTPSGLLYVPAASSWFVSTGGQGVDMWGGASLSISPNGPTTNLFSSVAVDERGVLWYATGISGQGRGFGRYDAQLPVESQWKNFTVSDFPVMGSNDYYKVSLGARQNVWVSSWGEGLVEVAGDSLRRKFDETTVPALSSSVLLPPPYVVVGSVAVDPDGVEWIVNRTAANSNYLPRLINDSTFAFTTNQISPGQGLFTSMVIDLNGSKWIANAEPFNKPITGLYYYHEGKIISGTSATGGWGWFTTSDGLPSNTVLSLAVDRDGYICVGTDLGLMIISEPLFPKQRHFTSFPLREQSIQALAVDALNNKWVGTKEGVFVMNSDATQILRQFTVSNTSGKLLDNDIMTLSIDQQRGVVYIGTAKGLSGLSIEAVSPLRSSTDLSIGPNPFILPSPSQAVIRNLVAESTIKILTVNGSLVSEFRAQGGGRAFWDGRDQAGNLVNSGIYFVVAFAENGDQVATGKIAVIRK